MKKICIISLSDVQNDVRVIKQVKALKDNFEITIIGYGNNDNKNTGRYQFVKRTKKNYLKIILFLLLNRIIPIFGDILFWGQPEHQSILGFLEKNDFDLVYANDWEPLIIANSAKYKKRPKIIFDAHEYSPEMGINSFFERYFIGYYRECFLKDKQLNRHELMFTVSEGIADLYIKNFKFKPKIILNVADYVPLKYKDCHSPIKIIHHGHCLRSRRIELFIKLINKLDDRFHLYLMLFPTDKKYYKEINRKIHLHGQDRIFLIPPVKRDILADFLNRNFDMIIPSISSKNLNNFFSLPNKFFESIIAGLAIATTNFPNMARIINEYNIGIFTKKDSIADLAKELNGLDIGKINRYKQNSLILAKSLNSTNEMKKILDYTIEVLNDDK